MEICKPQAQQGVGGANHTLYNLFRLSWYLALSVTVDSSAALGLWFLMLHRRVCSVISLHMVVQCSTDRKSCSEIYHPTQTRNTGGDRSCNRPER